MIELKHCRLEMRPYGIETVFPDGLNSSNWPPDDVSFLRIVSDCGFNDPIAYIRDHDLSHAFLAERMFDIPSPVLWMAAHCVTPHGGNLGAFEERTVYYWQRFISKVGPCIEPEWKEWAADYLRLRARV